MIDLEKMFNQETGQDTYVIDFDGSCVLNNRYVEWLEDTLLKTLTKDLTFTE